MTNEEVMQLCTDLGLHEGGMDNWVMDNAWVKFANLVAAHTLSNIDPRTFMSCQEACEAARLAEREACAKVCEIMEQQAEGTECCKWPTPIDCAAAIRARKENT